MDGWNTFSFPIGAKGLFSGALTLAGFVSGGVDFRILLITYLDLTSHDTRLQGCG